MEVTVAVQGVLKEYFARETMTVTLPEQARLRDLIALLGNELHADMRQPYWNAEQQKFRGPVLTIIDGVTVWDENALLHSGQSIVLKRFLIGG